MSVIKNSFFVLLARITELVSGVVVVGLTTRYLGAAGFGEYAFVGTTAVALSPLVALGCGRILVRDVAVAAGRAGPLVASALWLNAALAAVTLGAALVVMRLVPGRSPMAAAAMTVAVVGQGLWVMQQTVTAVFIAREQMVFDPLIVIGTRLLLLALSLAVVIWRLSYPWFFVASAAAGGAGLLLALQILVRRFARPQFGLRWTELRYLARESAPVAAYNFLGQSYAYAGVLLLTWLAGLKEVAFFQAPLRVLGPLMILPMSLLFAFTPALARLGADAAAAPQLRQFYERAVRLMLAAVLPLGVAVHVLAPYLVRLLFGADFADSANPFRLLSWALGPFALNALLNTILTSLHRQTRLIFTHLAALAVNLALGPWLILRAGHTGASLAFLLSIVVLFLINHRCLTAVIGGPVLWRAAWRPVLATAGLAGGVWLGAGRLPPLLLAALAVPAYAGLCAALRVLTVTEVRAWLGRQPRAVEESA